MASLTRIDMAGRRYGNLVVIAAQGKLPNGGIMWECQCDCGVVKRFRGSDLRRGHTKSCGCSQPRPKTEEIIRLALHGHDATYASKEVGRGRDYVLQVIRRAKKDGRVPLTLWGPRARISHEAREGVLNDWASCMYREYEIVLRNNLPPKSKIAQIIERGRLNGDQRAIRFAERAVRLDAYKQSLVVEQPRVPTLAEQIGIRIGPVIVKYNTDHQTTIPRRNVITLSGGLTSAHI